MFSTQQVFLLFIALLNQRLLQQQQQQHILCNASATSVKANNKLDLTFAASTTSYTTTTTTTTISTTTTRNRTTLPPLIITPLRHAKVIDMTNTNNGKVAGRQEATSAQRRRRIQIVTVQANCTRELFEMQLVLNSAFRGLLYAKDFPWECRARGNADINITLRVPTSGCGVRAEPTADGGMEYSVRVMLQMEQKLRQSTDILRTVRCMLPATAMGMQVQPIGVISNNNNNNNKNNKQTTHRNARLRNLADAGGISVDTVDSSAAPIMPVRHVDTPRVRIWLELGGPNGSGSVEVGVATTLTVRAIVPGTIGVRVVDCAALDGLGESTQQLLDERGCPIDEQVMPALHTRFKPAEEGWSKQREEDLVEKTFSATFPAFKFPDRERLHVSCGVQLCKGNCPNLNCRSTEPFHLSGDKHLARIEVFNSLAVTAPQIEVDRLRYDRRHNMSDDYTPRPFPSEGTLCLSISKLAISFCVLGLIFLIAVVVAISSLIRTRRRAQNCGTGSTINSSSRIHRAEICTSMFSSSSESAQSARFGSKLFIPYYPNTLPYGRVY